MKKGLAFLLIPIMILTILSSCNRSYNEAEVKSAAITLLEKSILVNEVFYGVGITVDTTRPELSSGNYKVADDAYLGKLGVYDINGIKELTKTVYTGELCDIIFSTKLTSARDSDGNIISYARYSERKEGSKKYILVYTAAQKSYENDVEYLYDTLRVVGSDGEYIIINVDVKLTTFDGFSRYQNVEFLLLEEYNGFRLDTLSFVKY